MTEQSDERATHSMSMSDDRRSEAVESVVKSTHKEMSNQINAQKDKIASLQNQIKEREQTNQSKQVVFSDGRIFFVSDEWVSKCPILNGCPIIYRSSSRFEKYIIPLLYGSSMKSESNDSSIEIDELLEEVIFYQITLTDDQWLNILQVSSFIEKINKIKGYIQKKEDSSKCSLFSHYKERIASFETLWNGYVGLIAKKKSDDRFNEISYVFIHDMLVGSNFYEITEINKTYSNIIFEFIRWFQSFVCEKRQAFISFKLTLQLSLKDNGITSTISSVSDTISGLISSTKSKSIDRAVLAKSIKLAETKSHLLMDSKYPNV
jgi:hypothetical protein